MGSSANGRACTSAEELAEILARAEQLGIDPRRVITALAIPADAVDRLRDLLRSPTAGRVPE